MADPFLTVAARLAPAFGSLADGPVDPVVRPSDRADAQANGALPLAKTVGGSPREVAQKVLDAAGDLIVERGFGALTLAAIGERAGFSRGLVTARFGSKHGLIDALLDRIFLRWEQAKDEPGSESLCGRDRIVRMIGAIHSSYLLDPASSRVLWALMFEAIGPDEALRLRIVQFHDQLRDELAGYLERGLADKIGRAHV